MSSVDQYGTTGSFDQPVEAKYVTQQIPDFSGNPFIECLPPILPREAVIAAMEHPVFVSARELAEPREVRLHMLGAIEFFMQPLNMHIELYSRLSALLRWGYVKRNPLRKDFLQRLLAGLEMTTAEIEAARISNGDHGKGTGLTLLGQSGVGKTTAVLSVLRMFPQVIRHPRLEGALRSVNQIVWLVVSCPPQGSMTEMCSDFFRQVDRLLDTDYEGLYRKRGATADDLRGAMAKVAYIHGLGMLVIDELQNLNEAKAGVSRMTMMNFFKLLRDVMQVPVVTVGTMQALGLVGGNSQNARRHTDFPLFERMPRGDEFQLFCVALFDAQYVGTRIDLDDNEDPETGAWLDLLYDLSQGVAAVVVKLFMVAQHRAISNGDDMLTREHVVEVYQSCFRILHRYLDRMRAGTAVDDGDFDVALNTLDRDSLISAVDAQSAVSPPKPARAPRIPALRAVVDNVMAADVPPEGGLSQTKTVGIRKGRSKRRKGEVSPVHLIAVVEAGEATEASAHSSLKAANLLRSLADEFPED